MAGLLQNPNSLLRQKFRTKRIPNLRDDARCVLQPNDFLFLYTDGITEAGMRDREIFGEKRLETLLLESAAEPVSEICRKTIQTVTDYSNGDLADDATILMIRRTA